LNRAPDCFIRFIHSDAALPNNERDGANDRDTNDKADEVIQASNPPTMP